MSWRSVAYQALDRPGGRRLLGWLGSWQESRRAGEPCRVRYKDGFWLHSYDGAAIPGERIGGWPPRAWEAHTKDVFCYGYTPKAGDVVIDVGAGIGTEVLAFSRMVGPTGRVYAIEAHPRTCAMLKTLCEMNRLANVVPAQLAIADRPGVLRISDVEAHVANTIVAGTARGFDVPAVTLDSFVQANRIARLDFVKVNIEGAERYALPGMLESIRRIRHLCVACHDFLAEGPGGDPTMRTREFVHTFLEEQRFSIVSRPDDPRAPVRWFVYATADAGHDVREQAGIERGR
jgi:FkbM family methyltransferase